MVALLVAGTAACGTTAGPVEPSPSVEPVAGLQAEVVRLRTDEAVGRRLQVRLTNTGDEAFAIGAAALDSPGFAGLPDTAVTAQFAPGRVIDLPVPYGDPVCDADPLPAVARLTLVRPGGVAEPVRAPLSAEVLQVVHDEECAVRAVLEVVDVAVTGLAEDGDVLTGSLELTRREGDDRVRATALGRSVLVDVTAEGLPVVLDRGERAVRAPVSFTPATCDPHVLSETKKPYGFPLTVQVGDDDPVPVDLPLDPAQRDGLAALVQRVCA
ncbi:hypothetical protein SAMN05216574_1185 [Blastococcus tunisiensis]|uniref:Uncharacterized protein n=1 Tax=Blastococcus tunisiensis TaxID=1798228 RepID=A0A1I2JW48_9ACTN|nr:hypothetical protein SAMN05216574_1185 [Blastococcus sp. DSM 46838]